MNKYIVSSESNLALKYRPKLIGDLVGQDHIQKVLYGMLNSRQIHQSILIHGASGLGKTTIARMIARYVNCQDIQENEAGDAVLCGKCDSCQYDTSVHPDILELNAADTRGIDDARKIVRNAQLAPNFNFRVFILDELHMLTHQAREMFLKPLEEPSPRTIWILCTTNPEKLTPTMRGRCRQLEVKPLEEIECAKLLRRVCKSENIGEQLKKEQFLTIARLSGCQPRAALQSLGTVLDQLKSKKGASEADLTALIEESVSLPPYQIAKEFLKAAYAGNTTKCLLALEKSEESFMLGKLLVEYHYKATRYFVSEKLRSNEYMDRMLYEEISSFKPTHTQLSFIMTCLIEANGQLAEFQSDAKYVLTAKALEICQLMKVARD